MTVLTQPDADGAGSTYAALVTEYEYDSDQKLTEITFPDETTQSWTYDPDWNVPDSFTDELGRTTAPQPPRPARCRERWIKRAAL